MIVYKKKTNKKTKNKKKNRLIGFELRRKQGMIRNLPMNERNMDSAQCS